MDATISIRLLGLGTSRLPTYCVEQTIRNRTLLRVLKSSQCQSIITSSVCERQVIDRSWFNSLMMLFNLGDQSMSECVAPTAFVFTMETLTTQPWWRNTEAAKWWTIYMTFKTFNRYVKCTFAHCTMKCFWWRGHFKGWYSEMLRLLSNFWLSYLADVTIFLVLFTSSSFIF